MPGMGEQTGAKVRRALEAVPRELALRMKDALDTSGDEWFGKMQNRLRGDPLNTRSGQLRRSLRNRVTGSSLSGMTLRLTSSGARHARIQERGGTITPSKARNLAIPLKAAKTPAGVARYTARRAFEKFRGKIWVGKSKRGNLLIFRKRGKTARSIRPLFVLKKRVKLPGPDSDGSRSRLGFVDTWNKLEPKRNARFRKALEASLRSAVRRTG